MVVSMFYQATFGRLIYSNQNRLSMKKITILLAAILITLGLKAQTSLTQAVDFTATDCHGTEVNLFDILDGGQYVLIDFFYTTCGPCNQAAPKIVEAYSRLGCNMHDVFFMEISTSDPDVNCQNWCANYGVEFPTISSVAGGSGICQSYGVTAYPTVILIAPNHEILIQDLFPITTAQTIVSALGDYGVSEYDCSVTVDPDVEITINDVTASTVEASFAPNEACASYKYMIAQESEMPMWMQMFNATIEELVMSWGILASGPATYTWTDQTPGTEYTVYVVPMDADGVVYSVIKKNVTTLSQGGAGEAIVELSVNLISNTSATIIASPNAETAEYHYGFIEVDYYNEIGEAGALDIFRNDGYPYYEASQFTWINLKPETRYYALGTAINANGEWGATTMVELFTDITGIVEVVNAYTIYPNPAVDVVIVRGEGFEKAEVFNIAGQKVMESNDARIDVKSLNSGVYMVKVYGNGSIEMQRVIVK